MDTRATLTELGRRFVPPVGFDRSVPREVRLKPAGRVLFVIAFVCFVGAVTAFTILLRHALHTPRFPVWPAFVVGALIAILGLASALWLRLERDLIASGRATAGIVTKQTRSHSSHGSHDSMSYEFLAMSGALMKGRASTRGKASAVGTAISVVYDPDRPRRNMPYPVTFVRPAATMPLVRTSRGGTP